MSEEKGALTKISSLDGLVSALKSGLYQEALSQSYNLKITESEIKPYITWNSNRYTRNCIARDVHFELILLCWEKGQKTAIHCHNEQECWVKVIRGDFEECLYEFDEEMNLMNYIKTDHVLQNQVTTINDSCTYHSLENTYHCRSLSLHLYMKPIYECTVFDQETNQIETKSLFYDTLEGKSV